MSPIKWSAFSDRSGINVGATGLGTSGSKHGYAAVQKLPAGRHHRARSGLCSASDSLTVG
jgi:hypothetical protein